MAKINYTHAQLLEIKEAYESGQTLHEIAEVYPGSWMTIQRRLKDIGVELRESGKSHKTSTEKEVETRKMIQLVKDGISARQVDKKLGLSVGVTRKRLKKLGVDLSYSVKMVCQHCGRDFIARRVNQVFCSDNCCRNEADRRRYNRKRSQVQDKDITLKKLIERDKNICYLCGRPCDISDKDGYKVGNSYPTVDHVIPISKGGTDTWDNVRLAHHICNSYKSDKAVTDTSWIKL